MDYVRRLKTLSEKVLLPFNEFSKQLRVVGNYWEHFRSPSCKSCTFPVPSCQEETVKGAEASSILRGGKYQFSGDLWFVGSFNLLTNLLRTPMSSLGSLSPLHTEYATPLPRSNKGSYGGICLINLSNKHDSCSRAYVDEWPSAAPSLYICQSLSRASRVKRDKLDPKRRPFTFLRPPCGAPSLHLIQVLGGTLECLLAYSIFTIPTEVS